MLYIVRHAHALPDEEDPERPLSSRGWEQAKRLSAFLTGKGLFQTGEIWHSPLLRSRQTAEVFAASLGTAVAQVETSGMLPEDDPAELASRVRLRAAADSLAIVGHEPNLSALASLLVVGSARPAAFRLRKGSVLALERVAGGADPASERWQVQWQIGPELPAA